MKSPFSPDLVTPPFATDPAAVLRATGLLRSYMAGDYSHVNDVLKVMVEDQDGLLFTFSALAVIAAAAALTIVEIIDVDVDVDQTLTMIASQIIGYRPTDTPDERQ
jgi:hypothetical protein